MQIPGLLEDVLCPVFDVLVLALLIEQVRHAGSYSGHGFGAGRPYRHFLRLVIGEQGGPNGVGQEHFSSGGILHVSVIILNGVDYRLELIGFLHYTNNHQGGGIVLDGLTNGILALEQQFRGVTIDNGDRPVFLEILGYKGAPFVHHIPAGGEIGIVHTVDLAAGNLLVSIVEGVSILPAGIHGSVFHLGQVQDLFVKVLAYRGNTLRNALVADVVHIVIIGTVQLYSHHVVACTDQILFDLLVGALDGGHNGNNGCDANDDAQHGEEGAHFVGPDALERKTDIFDHPTTTSPSMTAPSAG